MGTGGPRGGRRGEGVGDVHPGLAPERGRDQVGVEDRHCPAGEAQDDEITLGRLIDAERGPAPADVPVDAHEPTVLRFEWFVLLAIAKLAPTRASTAAIATATAITGRRGRADLSTRS